MKSLHWLVLAGTAIVAMGCSGKPSPEAQIQCGTVDGVSYIGADVGFFLIQKAITATDDGAGGPVPANGIVATVMSPVASVQICEGDCLDGTGGFSQEQDVTTSDDAILTYTLGLDPTAGSYEGVVTESFNALSQCQTDVSVSSTLP